MSFALVNEIWIDFEIDPEYPIIENNITFLPKTSYEYKIIKWLWDFDDGNISTDKEPTHFFTKPDYYDVTLTVETSKGDRGNVVKRVHVSGKLSHMPLLGSLLFIIIFGLVTIIIIKEVRKMPVWKKTTSVNKTYDE
jgi:hypothetical protein